MKALKQSEPKQVGHIIEVNPITNQDKAAASPFLRLELAILADSFDGTISKEGRAELVHALKAFKAEHSALAKVAELWDDPSIYNSALGGISEAKRAKVHAILSVLAAVRKQNGGAS